MSDTQTKAEFTMEQVDVITCIEQLFWENGGIPTNEKIHELTGVSLESIKRYWELEHFRTALLHRGVDLNPNPSALLTLEQLQVANRLLNLADNRSIREKLKECNVSPQKYAAWMRTDAFRNHIARRAEELFKGADSDAYLSIIQAIRGGDMRATQLFLEMRGLYNPKMQINTNVELLMSKMLEVLQRHISPELLLVIATEFEQLSTGVIETNGQQIPVPAPMLQLPEPPPPTSIGFSI